MFSVIFPGQGSQSIGMGKEFYDKFDLVKKLFKEADDVLDLPLSKYILEGPKEKLDLTANTQPAIFLIRYERFSMPQFSVFTISPSFFSTILEYFSVNCFISLGEVSCLAIIVCSYKFI